MNDNRNMILAIVLSALVLLGWSLLSDKLLPDRQSADAARSRTARSSRLPQPQRRSRPPTRPQAIRDRAIVLPKRRACAIETPSLRARSTSRARGSTIWCCPPSARPSPRIRRRCGCSRRPARQDSLFRAVRLDRRRASPRPTPTRVWTASAPRADARQAGDAELDQRHRPELRQIRLGRRRLSVHRRAARRQRGTGAGRRARPTASSAAPASRRDVDSWTIHVGPMGVFNGAADYDIDYNDARRRPGRRDASTASGGWLGFTDKYWLAALAPARRRADRGQLPHSAARRLPGRLSRRAGRSSRPGQAVTSETRTCSPAPRRSSCSSAMRTARHAKLEQGDRLGLVRMVHEADLLAADLAVRRRSAISAWRSSA